MKTYRLYFIFKSSINLRKSYHVMMSDGVLAVLIGILVALVASLCTAWSIYDPYVRNTIPTISPSGDTWVISTQEFCYCTYQVQWVASIVGIETIFIILIVAFAISTSIKNKKEFQTQKITVLTYILTLIGVLVGLIIYLVDRGVNISYLILSSLLTVTVFLCTSLLFIPPVLPVIRDILRREQQ